MSVSIRAIIRIAGRNVNGNKPLIASLRDIRGINFSTAMFIIRSLRLDPSMRLGKLNESQLQSLERAISDPRALNAPSWLLNRRKDIETGKDMHLLESDLSFKVNEDIEREKLMNSWKGMRHSLGLKVRGQRTRTTGRKGMAVGVRKKALVGQPSAPQPEAKSEGSEK